MPQSKSIAQCLSILLCSLCFLTGCTAVNQRIASRNTFTRDAMNEYRNDSLQLRILFYGNTYFGDEQIKVPALRRLFKYHLGSFPKKEVILWGEYQATRHPMYLVGTLVESIDTKDYKKQTSAHGSSYYYRISFPKDITLAEAIIPLADGRHLYVQEIAMYAENDLTASIRDAELTWKNILNSLAVGSPAYEQTLSTEEDFDAIQPVSKPE